jgi:aminoglycoside phosphotransferase (APT) family kinase protein
MPKDYYVQPDAPDFVLSEEKVLALARQHAPTVQAVTGVDETGGEARTYALDSDLILKTQRPQKLRPRTSLAKEVLFLRQLAGVSGVNAPRVLGYGQPELLLEYTLMTRMPGVAFRHAGLSGEARYRALYELGRMLRIVHSIPQEPLRTSGLFFGDQSPVDVRWRMGSLFDDVADMVRRNDKPWDFRLPPDEVGRRLMRTLPDRRTIVALHSNPGPEHTFVDPVSGKLTGIIDFGDAYFSHPVFDLRRYRAPADRRAVLEGYLAAGPLGDDFMAAWRVACGATDLALIASASEFSAAAAAELDQLLQEIE